MTISIQKHNRTRRRELKILSNNSLQKKKKYHKRFFICQNNHNRLVKSEPSFLQNLTSHRHSWVNDHAIATSRRQHRQTDIVAAIVVSCHGRWLAQPSASRTHAHLQFNTRGPEFFHALYIRATACAQAHYIVSAISADARHGYF